MLRRILCQIIYQIIQITVFFILTTDIFVAVTSKVRRAGKFIRFFRNLAYSITPLIYLLMILVIWRLNEHFHLDHVFAALMMLGLAAGCCITYADDLFRRKKSRKRRIRTKTLTRSVCCKELTILTENERS